MNDFEQWLKRQDEEEASMFSSQWRVGWQAAKQSMQGEQVGAVMNTGGIYVGNLKPGLADGVSLYASPPPSTDLTKLVGELVEAMRDLRKHVNAEEFDCAYGELLTRAKEYLD